MAGEEGKNVFAQKAEQGCGPSVGGRLSHTVEHHSAIKEKHTHRLDVGHSLQSGASGGEGVPWLVVGGAGPRDLTPAPN